MLGFNRNNNLYRLFSARAFLHILFVDAYFRSVIFWSLWQINILKVTEYQILIGLAVRVFANGPGDLGSIPSRIIPKTQKMVLDASLLNT